MKEKNIKDEKEKITKDELEQLEQFDSRILNILKKLAPDKFGHIEDSVKIKAAREKAVKKLQAYRARKEKLPILEKDAEDKLKKAKEIKKQFREAKKISIEARAKYNLEHHDVDMGIHNCRYLLMQTAPIELRKRFEEINDEMERLRQEPIVAEKIEFEPFPGTGFKDITSYPEITEKITALQTEQKQIIAEMLNIGE